MEQNIPTLQRKIEDNIIEKSSGNNNLGIREEVSGATDAKSLEIIIKNFANRKILISKNSSISIISHQLARKYKVSKSDLSRLAGELDAAIYANKQINFEDVKSGFSKILEEIEKKEITSDKSNNMELKPLNPS